MNPSRIHLDAFAREALSSVAEGALVLDAGAGDGPLEVPYDFYRYKQYGFGYLLRAAGFSVKRMDWLEGYLGTLSYQLDVACRSMPIRSRHYGGGLIGMISTAVALCLKPFLAVLSVLLGRIDVRYRFTEAGQCKNYAIVAGKGSAKPRG